MQSFAEIRERGFVYVDKSQYIEQLFDLGKYFFLGRPRRFGKSLFISMLQAYFEGRRDLFDGLAASRYYYDWEPHPVLHLDFTGQNYTENENVLIKTINAMLEVWERKYGCEVLDETVGTRFQNIIKTAVERTGKKVVILIDEYDKPLLDTIDFPKLQEKYRNELRGIYGNLKNMDTHIKFAFLTGITRFGKLNIFSDINNLNDISMMPQFGGICGITPEELSHFFAPGIESFAETNGMTREEAFEDLRMNYDGYHFSTSLSPDVYNPFSLLKAFQDCRIGEYWFGTGTPSFLVQRIKSGRLELEEYEDVEVEISDIENVSFDLDGDPVPVLYQTGYLTIKGYENRLQIVRLGYPNREVRRGFMRQLLNAYLSDDTNKSEFSIMKFIKDVESGNAELFMERLESLMAGIDYDSINRMTCEQHFQNILYLLFRLMGFRCETEYKTANGRMDMVVGTERFIYVFEFKLNRSAEEALRQIDSKEYLLPFVLDGRKLVKIGANFSTAIKNLDSWIIA